MPNIYASPEVLQLIGAETLRKLETAAFFSYICVHCGEFGNTAEPTNVVVYRYRGVHNEVELAHASCTASGIVEVDADPPDRSRGDMAAVTLALGYQDEPIMRPLLLLEPRTETIDPADGVDRVTMPMAALLGSGLTFMTSGSQLPELAQGWRLERPGPDSARLVEASGSVVYSGPCDQPTRWAELVDSAGTCVVLIGTIGLYAVPDGRFTTEQVRRMLAAAADEGMLAGGIVTCAPSPAAGRKRGRAAG